MYVGTTISQTSCISILWFMGVLILMLHSLSCHLSQSISSREIFVLTEEPNTLMYLFTFCGSLCSNEKTSIELTEFLIELTEFLIELTELKQ